MVIKENFKDADWIKIVYFKSASLFFKLLSELHGLTLSPMDDVGRH